MEVWDDVGFSLTSTCCEPERLISEFDRLRQLFDDTIVANFNLDHGFNDSLLCRSGWFFSLTLFGGLFNILVRAEAILCPPIRSSLCSLLPFSTDCFWESLSFVLSLNETFNRFVDGFKLVADSLMADLVVVTDECVSFVCC